MHASESFCSARPLVVSKVALQVWLPIIIPWILIILLREGGGTGPRFPPPGSATALSIILGHCFELARDLATAIQDVVMIMNRKLVNLSACENNEHCCCSYPNDDERAPDSVLPFGCLCRRWVVHVVIKSRAECLAVFALDPDRIRITMCIRWNQIRSASIPFALWYRKGLIHILPLVSWFRCYSIHGLSSSRRRCHRDIYTETRSNNRNLNPVVNSREQGRSGSHSNDSIAIETIPPDVVWVDRDSIWIAIVVT